MDMMKVLTGLDKLSVPMIGAVRNLIKTWPEADADEKRAIEATLLAALLLKPAKPSPVVRVGLGTLIFKDGSVLLHERGEMSHCPGVWASPGGHLEMFETWQECAIREIREECGPDLQLTGLRYWDTVDTPYPDEGKHYVTIFFKALWLSGEARVMEPDKCKRWEWVPWLGQGDKAGRNGRGLMTGNLRMFQKHPNTRGYPNDV